MAELMGIAPPKVGTVDGAVARVPGSENSFAVLLTALCHWWPLVLRPACGEQHAAHAVVLSRTLEELPRCSIPVQLAALLRRCLPALCPGDGDGKGCYTQRRSFVAKTPRCSHGHGMELTHESTGRYVHGWVCDTCGAESRHLRGQQRWCCVRCVEDICQQCWSQ